MIKELGIDRFQISCGHCDYTGLMDYDVQHVDDGYGHALNYYSLNGQPCLAPTTPGALACPYCGAQHLSVRLVAHRSIPLAPAHHDDTLAQRVALGLGKARADTPLLDARTDPSDDLTGNADPVG